jgi:hypothetical protein
MHGRRGAVFPSISEADHDPFGIIDGPVAAFVIAPVIWVHHASAKLLFEADGFAD